MLQGIIFHEELEKRIPALNQIRKGLKLLGVGDMIENNVELFEELFCYKSENFTPESLLNKLAFNENQIQQQPSLHNFFLDFISNATKETLKKFCRYCTGSSCLPISKKIQISYEGCEGFVASTCSFTLDIPVAYKSREEFLVALESVIEGNTFSSV